jgi:hypothetical protein
VGGLADVATTAATARRHLFDEPQQTIQAQTLNTIGVKS